MKINSSANHEQSEFLHKWGIRLLPYFGLILLVIIFQITSKGLLLTNKNLALLFSQGYALLIAAVAGIFVVATGNLDFSMGANLAFSSACACIVAQYSVGLALPAALLVGTLIGMLNGILQVFLRLPSFIECLTMMFILIAGTQTLTGGGSMMMPVQMMSFDNPTLKLVVIFVFLSAMIFLFEYAKIGKHLKAIGVSEEASRQSGVQVGKMRIISYTITGFAAGLAGYFTLLRAGAASPMAGQTTAIDAIIALVLGGMSITGGATSKIMAAIIGTTITAILSNGLVLAGWGGDAQQLIKGLIFIIIVAVSTKKDQNAIII